MTATTRLGEHRPLATGVIDREKLGDAGTGDTCRGDAALDGTADVTAKELRFTTTGESGP